MPLSPPATMLAEAAPPPESLPVKTSSHVTSPTPRKSAKDASAHSARLEPHSLLRSNTEPGRDTVRVSGASGPVDASIRPTNHTTARRAPHSTVDPDAARTARTP